MRLALCNEGRLHLLRWNRRQANAFYRAGMWQSLRFPNNLDQFVTWDVDNKLLASQNILRCPMCEIATQGKQGGFKSHHRDPALSLTLSISGCICERVCEA